MAKNSCQSVRGTSQRPQLAPGHRVRHRERVAPQHIDVLMQQGRQPGHVLFLDGVALGTQLRQARLHVGEHQELWEVRLPAAGGPQRCRWPCLETSARRVTSTTRPACGSGSAAAGAPHVSSTASADAWRSAC